LPTRVQCLVVAAFAVGTLTWGCETSARRAPLTVSCAALWTQQLSPDSLVNICTPPGFTPGSTAIGGSYTWKRPAPSPADSDWVAVAIVADSAGHEQWPPLLESPAGCSTDCYTVDSAVVHTDSNGLTAIRLETGLVSGGTEGARRAPRLVGGWITPRRTRILVVGAAEHAMTLDTLRAALRTLRVRTP
jgi:hypothetical protein